MLRESRSREQFIEENLGLVHSLCKRFVGRGIEYDDLYQAGCIGLIKATDAFDETRGLCFSTYAVPVILGEIRRLFRDGGIVKMSRSLKELSLKTVRMREQLEIKLGREPTVSELAEELSVTPEEITEALCAAQPTISFTCKSDDAVREFDIPQEDNAEQMNDHLMLESAFKNLSQQEQKLILLRYYRNLSQSRIAAQMGMTQVQVSRAEKKILQKLREIVLY